MKRRKEAEAIRQRIEELELMEHSIEQTNETLAVFLRPMPKRKDRK